MVIQKAIYLDEQREKQIKRIKEYLLSIGMLDSENLSLVAYELNFNDIFSYYLNGKIQSKHERKVSEGNFTRIYHYGYNPDVELMIGLGFKDNKISVECSYRNNEYMKNFQKTSTISLLGKSGHLYYDSDVVEKENGKIKSFERHLVRDNGKCLFIAKPDIEEEKYIIPILKR